MSVEKQPASPAFGHRTLPQSLDDLAASHTNRIYASVPKGRDLSDGFIDITCQDMARCVNFMALWISTHLGLSRDFTTLTYVGIPDLRCVAVFLGAVKCGYKASQGFSLSHGSCTDPCRCCYRRLAILLQPTYP